MEAYRCHEFNKCTFFVALKMYFFRKDTILQKKKEESTNLFLLIETVSLNSDRFDCLMCDGINLPSYAI